MAKKPWAGRFTKGTAKVVEEYTASVTFDKRLYRADIEGSIAHAKALAKAKVITKEEAREIVSGLVEILKEIERGEFIFNPSLEDIHMNIERRLEEKIGLAAGKLHTARSRNDQVALDLRLYLRHEIQEIMGLARGFRATLVELAEKHLDSVMPGYTHLQRAQPVLFAHHLLAYFEMMDRDQQRLADCYKRVNIMPLGSGALAGTPFPIDRKYIARLLNFPEVSRNSIDAVSDRDFVAEFLAASSILMMHLSRLAEEIILWSSVEFGFIELDDAFATGSSLMPQKKNPDVAELARGKVGRVYGSLLSLLTTLKGLPLSYNRDLQEDKEPLFDAVDTVKASLRVLAPLLRTLKVHPERMRVAAQEGFLNATDLADYLVGKGMPFRQAHEVVGKIVLRCMKKGKKIEGLPLKELHKFSPLIGRDLYDFLSLEACINRRQAIGGTATENVRKALKSAKKRLLRFCKIW
ncbi:MAG: argininosuccinate lyase [candidate division NC10 bacterium]|nr:argininosuccinate lyase [candidate division NC10 bacterium]